VGSHQYGAKSSPFCAYSSYGRPGFLPYPLRKLFVRFCAAPPDAGIENNPCANVLGVSFGPAVWMPERIHTMFDVTAPACDAALKPQYHVNGLIWSDSGNCPAGGGGSGSVNGERKDSPNACTDWSGG
jgi:hypothetical protein